MNNTALFLRIKKLVSTERRIGVAILECLHEIEIKKAYAELRYDGLYTYCVKELGFSDAQAYQRIQAMRALKDLPELRPLITDGSLSVSAVSKVHTHLRQERKMGVRREEGDRLALFQSMQNCTSREVEVNLAAVRGEVLREKLVIDLDEELQALWRQVKDRAAHRSGGDSAEVLRILAKEWLSKNEPGRVAQRKTAAKVAPDPVQKSLHEKSQEVESGEENFEFGSQRAVPWSENSWMPARAAENSHQSTRYIPASIRREIWRRDGAQCTRCNSTYALEIDHREPFALGGENRLENLRILCRSCNQFQAVMAFGAEKIEWLRRRRFDQKTKADQSMTVVCVEENKHGSSRHTS